MKILQKGVTLIELLIVMVILGIFLSFAIATFLNADVDCRKPDQRPSILARVYEAAAIAKLLKVDIKIKTFELNHNRYPDTIDELVGHGGLGITEEDLWVDGSRMIFTPVWNTTNMGKVRKYKDIHPVNLNYDLYTLGRDGKTATPFTSQPGCDDIVVANDGQYVGYAYRFYAHASGK